VIPAAPRSSQNVTQKSLFWDKYCKSRAVGLDNRSLRLLHSAFVLVYCLCLSILPDSITNAELIMFTGDNGLAMERRPTSFAWQPMLLSCCYVLLLLVSLCSCCHCRHRPCAATAQNNSCLCSCCCSPAAHLCCCCGLGDESVWLAVVDVANIGGRS
jgi:hypothetical protein